MEQEYFLSAATRALKKLTIISVGVTELTANIHFKDLVRIKGYG